MGTSNKKSDVKAKIAFKEYLENFGFSNVRIVGSPADIIAIRDDKTYYFEIKMTKQSQTYFGAATLTEWMQALKAPDQFKFVIAKTDEEEKEFEFIEYTPAEFMEHSTIPPFKIYFNVSLTEMPLQRKRRSAIALTHETMELLVALHSEIRK